MNTPTLAGRRSYRWLAIGLFVAAGVYGWYVLIRFEHLNELNQRQVAKAGVELKRTLELAVSTVDNFRPKKTDVYALCRFDDDQPYLNLEEGDCSVNTGPLTRVTLSTESAILINAEPTLQAGGCRDLKKWNCIRFSFDTGKLLQELALPDTFNLVFVANAKGKVVFQDAPARRRWRQWLRRGEQTLRDSGADVVPSLQVGSLSEALEGGASPAWTALSASSTRTSLQLGGVWHQVYLQPVFADGELLVVGGVVPRAEVIRDALAFDSFFVAALVFLVLLGFFGFPFIKLASIDRCERFRLRDVVLLYLSTVALLALFTFAVLGLDGYWRWQDVADKGLDRLAHTLATQFTGEVTLVRDELEAYDRLMAVRHPKSCEDGEVLRRWFDKPDQLPPPQSPVFLAQVFSVRPDGVQMFKATIDRAGGLVDVGHRAYVKAVQDGDLYRIAGAGTAIFIGPERSIVDGRFRTFVSMASSTPEFFCGDKAGAARYTSVVGASLLSLHRPALPAGYGFAVVNRSGRVLYHSDPRRSLRENLFEELGDGDRARAMMYSGQAGSFPTRYGERPHQLSLEPIDIRRAVEGTRAGLYLAAFRDTSVERSAVGRVFVAGLAGPILLPLISIGVTMWLMGLASSVRTKRWSEWLWPHGGLEPMYRSLTLLLSAVCVVEVALCVAGFSDAVIFVMPLVAGVCTTLVYSRYARTRPARRPLTSPAWHTATLVLILAGAVVVPIGILFQTALDHEFGRLVATEREWLRAQQEDARIDLRSEGAAEGYPAAVVQRLVESRANYAPAAPPPFDSPSPGARHGVGVTIALLDAIDEVVPIDDDVDARQRYNGAEYDYSPPGTLPWPWHATGAAIVGFAVLLAAVIVWIRWSRNRIFFAACEGAAAGEGPPADPEKMWAGCTEEDERYVLMQVAREGVANPYQQPLVSGLIGRGLLRLAPELVPSTEPFGEFLRRQEPALASELAAWEQVHGGRGWGYMRNVFVASLAGLAFFLIATQPGLQSDLLSIAGGITGTLATAAKLRDAVASWFTRGKTNA